ncbi:3-oxoacyl-[acyl-carrier-protein] reductase FabG-like isoform X1 [Lytechinus variegatus]|uniref:3-oxoacyl-[acyl-carrier-protein] reductase FabG-like isoform X1 n=2 Tax=Lytechinus variegatus TaxID=7654 RepID=UPI001BB12AA4|nr:3-oxoacyl-[acyl-carrier-protein] reductase FabG-like isoform X1 [Lytechinus variegatus]
MAASMASTSLAGKVAIITGASSGIGAATSILFSRLGSKLVLAGRKEDNLKRTRDACMQTGDEEPLLVVGELRDSSYRENLVERTVEKYGKLDILVNNAGIISLGSIENSTLENYDTMMDVNVRSVFHLTSLAVPHLIDTRGNIVNVSSVNGIRAFAGVLSYCMSKAALDQFTRCAALDLAPKGVRVNSVNPGVTITELQKRGGLSDEAYANFLERSKMTHALGRPGEAGEIAESIAFLASDASSFITGATLPVDGGRHAMCPR